MFFLLFIFLCLVALRFAPEGNAASLFQPQAEALLAPASDTSR